MGESVLWWGKNLKIVVMQVWQGKGYFFIVVRRLECEQSKKMSTGEGENTRGLKYA